MKNFQIFQPLWMAFYSKPLYRDVGQNWRGLGLLYLCLLLAVAWLPELAVMHRGFRSWIASQGEALVQQFPDISIRDGEAIVEPPGPHVFNDPDTGKPFLVINLDATLEDISAMQGELAVLTRDKLVMRRERRGETRVFDLRNIQSLRVTRDDVRNWLHFLGNFFLLVLFPFLWLFSFVYRLAQILLYGGIGVLFARSVRVDLSYEAVVRLSAIAITAPVFLDVALKLLKVQITLWWLICFLIAMGYLHFAIQANKPEPASMPGVETPAPLG